jgi:hypothetical protein
VSAPNNFAAPEKIFRGKKGVCEIPQKCGVGNDDRYHKRRKTMKKVKNSDRSRASSARNPQQTPEVLAKRCETAPVAPITPEGTIVPLGAPPANGTLDDYQQFMTRVAHLDALFEAGKAYANWLTGKVILAMEQARIPDTEISSFRGRFAISRSKFFDCKLVATHCSEDEALAPRAHYSKLLELARRRAAQKDGADSQRTRRIKRGGKQVRVSDPPTVQKLLDQAERLVNRIDNRRMSSIGQANARKTYEDIRGLAHGIQQRCEQIIADVEKWLANGKPNKAEAA